jgi:hypothetical protein
VPASLGCSVLSLVASDSLGLSVVVRVGIGGLPGLGGRVLWPGIIGKARGVASIKKINYCKLKFFNSI